MLSRICATLALLVSFQALADDATPLTLQEAIAIALSDSPQLAASAAMLDAANASATAAGRLPDPELVVAVDNLPVNTADRFSFSRDFMTMRRIGLMQAFPNRSKRSLQRTYADQEIGVSRAELRKTRFETAQAAADAWIAVAVANESLTRLRELQPDAERQAAATRSALANGQVSAAEALTAQSVAAKLADRMLVFEQDAEVRNLELVRWLGIPAIRPLAPIPTDLEVGHSPTALVAGVAGHAPLAPLNARIAVARTEVDLARAEKHPDWSAGFSYQKRGAEFSDMVSLEFRVGLPFFSKHRQDPIIASKLATVRAEEAERDAEVRMHTAEVSAAVVEWRKSHERLQHYETELLPLAQDRTRAELAAFAAGRADLRSANEALAEEIDTEIEYVELRGKIAQLWTFLHFLHESGDAP